MSPHNQRLRSQPQRWLHFWDDVMGDLSLWNVFYSFSCLFLQVLPHRGLSPPLSIPDLPLSHSKSSPTISTPPPSFHFHLTQLRASPCQTKICEVITLVSSPHSHVLHWADEAIFNTFSDSITLNLPWNPPQVGIQIICFSTFGNRERIKQAMQEQLHFFHQKIIEVYRYL